VLITSAEGSSPGDWGTIKFRSEADDQSTISNSIIEYGTRGITLSSASPTISHSTFRNFSDNGIILFGDSAPTISGNTLSNNNRGLSCWENSKPRIVGNLITNNNRGVVCGNSAIPTIIGNSFDGNSEIGLALQEQTAVLNPTIAGNNFINQRSQTGAWGIFVFDSDTSPASISALHNYFGDSARNDTNTVDVQTSSSNGVVDIGQPGSSSRLSNPVDWAFSPASISFRDSGYASALSNVPPGSPLYIQMSGAGSDTTNANSTLVRVKSSATDATGIYVHLDETGADTGIYRTAETPETLASLGASSDQSIYRLGAAEGETATASFAADASVVTSALVLQCLVGDADNIGGVTVADIISLMRIAIGADPQPQTSQEICRQDIDGSGSVDIRNYSWCMDLY
jgi:parallel beta-helix repeat protein